MYNYRDIRVIHLEITDKCNASCPMCARNKNGGEVNQWLPLTELSLDDCKTIFPIDFITQLDRMYMCGNNGDPIIAKDTLNVYEYFRTHNSKMTLGMNTNGSARKADWWSDLAKIMDRYGYVTFGLDGLSDTHHLYRKDTNFEKIIENVQSFIRAGGRARWDFIVFEHNEHQIEEARELSEKIGFEDFRIKKTGRFFSNIQMKVKGYREVNDKDGKIIYTIKPPKNINLQNQSLQREQELIEKYGNMRAYLDQTLINCKVLHERSIFVSADGAIFPCCWTANQIYVWYIPKESSEIWKILNETGGIESINAKNVSIEEIVTGDFFNKIEKSWSINNIDYGKLKVCAKTCGQSFDQFRDQYV